MPRLAITWGAIAAALIILLFVSACTPAPAFTNQVPGPDVKIVLPGGHGSAVHIGNGHYITAAHVVKDATEVQIKADDGRVADGEVLWVNKARDIALVAGPRQYAAAPLACEHFPVGTDIVAKGNPLKIEFVNMWGKIAGVQREFGPWKTVYVADITILPGMSGGAVYNAQGEVIGTSIGLATASVGFGLTFTGMTFVVPSTLICDMLARR